MSSLDIILTAITSLLGVICGGGGFLFYREKKRNKQTENKSLEIDAIKKALDIVQELLEKSNTEIIERDIKLDERDTKIDALLVQISTLKEENAQLNQKNLELCWYKCIKAHCELREPPRGI